LGLLDAIVREATLFAAVGFLIGGIDDLAVDAVYFARYGWRRLRGRRDTTLADLPAPGIRFAVFVPAWQEAAVIAPMLRTALTRFGSDQVRLYVAVYPNDVKTLEAVKGVRDSRIRVVLNPRSGPTTKADNLNACWRALIDDEADGDGVDAIVLHDAEDVVHPGELAVYAAWLERYDAVQIPVAPLPDPHSHYVGGSYMDEFSEAHGKNLVVRQALGAGLPFAGTGCAIRRAMLGRVADARGGAPFDAASLTEDYELGLTIAAMGGKTALAWVTEADGRTPVAVRAFFPGQLRSAIRQKSRWMVGIALAGWDRTGWGRAAAVTEHWMRMRDRRAPLAVLVLLAAYLSLVLWALGWTAHALSGTPATDLGPLLTGILWLNLALLGWRLLLRALFVGKAEGWREGLRALPRMAVGNLIALLAVQRALVEYAGMLRGAPTRWDKTTHHFPGGLG
jgi:bacteriophage N4 adsorption protein B